MKRLLHILLLIFIISLQIQAQYLGGDGDGTAVIWQTDLRLDGLFLTVVFNGGLGDGADYEFNTSPLSTTTNFSNLYLGGIGNGEDDSNFEGFLSQDSALCFYNGGDGDGHSFSLSSLLMNSDVLTDIFTGGFGDGTDLVSFNGILNDQIINIYEGGNADGHDYSYVQTNLNLNSNPLYAGGLGDGADYNFQLVKFPLCNCTPSVKVFVNINNPGLNNGSTWQHAFESLPNAFQHASICNVDSIWVSKGVYLPIQNNDREISFVPPEGVSIYGGFIGTEEELNDRNFEINESILSGNIGDQNNLVDNSFHVLNYSSVGEYSLIDGFHIEHGNANGLNNNSMFGGGIYNVSQHQNQNIFLSNSTIRNCLAQDSGSGIYLKKASSKLTLSNVKLISNIDPLQSQTYLDKMAKLIINGPVVIIN